MAKRYNLVTRCIAAIALVFVYFVGASAVLVGASTTPAQARGGGFRGGGFRGGGFRGGWGRGRGVGLGLGLAYPYAYGAYPYGYGGGCYWSRRWGRYICPYY